MAVLIIVWSYRLSNLNVLYFVSFQVLGNELARDYVSGIKLRLLRSRLQRRFREIFWGEGGSGVTGVYSEQTQFLISYFAIEN